MSETDIDDQVPFPSPSRPSEELDMPSGRAFKPLTASARWAVVALVITGIADVIAVVLDWDRYELLRRIESGGAFTLRDVNASDHRQAVMAVIQLCLFAATATLFIRWFWRAYKNVDALGGKRRFGTGWAIGGWFVPVLSLWRPKQISNDLWLESEPGWSAQSIGRPSPLLTWWWAAFLIGNWISMRSYAAAGTTAHDVKSAVVFSIAGDLIDMVAVALAVELILRLTSRQRQRAAERSSLRATT